MKKFLFWFLVVVFFMGAGVFTYLFFFVKSSAEKIIVHDSTAKKEPVDAMEKHFVDKTSFNLLLIGYGGGNHDGTYLTDSIMVAHIDPKQKATYLVSIPRDVWTVIPSDGDESKHGKINSAYQIGLDDDNYPNKLAKYSGEAGGGNLVKEVVGKVVGVNLDNFVGVDFAGFTQAIDSLHEVTITVEKTFDDYSYPITGKEADPCGHTEEEIASLSAQLASPSAEISELDAFPCRYEHLHFDKGVQQMDGITALKYVRSRHSLQDGTDFGRAKRQRNLITAVKQKVFSIGFIPQIMPLLSTLKDNVRTDLSLDDIQVLIKHANELNGYKIHTLALTDENFLENGVSSDGQFILQPKAGLDDWSEVHAWIQQEFRGISSLSPTPKLSSHP
jgi:LCP family protein required for cell wall assembly